MTRFKVDVFYGESGKDFVLLEARRFAAFVGVTIASIKETKDWLEIEVESDLPKAKPKNRKFVEVVRGRLFCVKLWQMENAPIGSFDFPSELDFARDKE